MTILKSLSRWRVPAVKISLVALAYALAGWLGLRMPNIGEHITLIWLPTGIAVAALHRWHWGVWPGIFLGAFAVNLSIGSSAVLAAGIAAGNTAAPVFVAWLLRRNGFHATFDRRQDVVLFMLAAGLGMMISATNGVANLYLAGLLPFAAIGHAWLEWWMGDAVGVLLAAPFLLTCTRNTVRLLARAPRGSLAWLAAAAVIGWLAFMHDCEPLSRTLALAFLSLPLVTWAGLRFGISGASLSALLFSGLAAMATQQGYGVFYPPDEHTNLILLWVYMTTTVMTGLTITALQGERLRVEQNLRASEEKLRGLFDLSPLGIAMTDMQGRYVEFNEAFRRISGYPTEELKALDYWKLTPEKYRDDEAQQLRSLAESGHYGPYEKEYVRQDGSHVPLRLNGMLVNGSDGHQYIWSLVEDITDRKRAEAELDAYREGLERLVQERTQELHLAKAAAEAANAAKSAFLANMSHEIRTPLNAITATAHLVRKAGLTPMQGEQVAKLEKSSRHLTEVINDILDLSKIEAGKFELAEDVVDFNLLAVNIQSILQDRLTAKGLEYAPDLPVRLPILRGDATRLQQALLNYASNAVKCTERGRITVRIRIEEESDDDAKVRFEVEDTGIGIAPDILARLFSPFEQADNSLTREYGGTGLGLAITRKIAESMGGEAGATSAPGQGSTFWFTARMGKATHESPSGAATEPAATDVEAILRRDHAGRRILLAEDDLLNGSLFKKMLEDAGLYVDVAEDGAAAVALVAENTYDLVLMDMRMPLMDGPQAAQKIRQMPGQKAQLPILALTANAFIEDRQRCLDAGMNDFIAKPVHPAVLFSKLLRWLSSERSS